MPERPQDQPPIEDYAAIGNGHSVALVSKRGGIDWWCPMRFDRPSVFAALLDVSRGGHFYIRPSEACTVTRRYVDGTNVLETTFESSSGRVRLIDFMPLGMPDRRDSLQPHHAVLRIVECEAGEVEMEIGYAPRFAYGEVRPGIRDRRSMGFWCAHKAEALNLRTSLALDLDDDGHGVSGRVAMRRGERHVAALSYARGEPLIVPPLAEEASNMMRKTIERWQQWTSQCDYDGPFRDAVVRSALVLKMMIYAPSGAVVAAPTTSLPEEIGGVRNWDYRYCWLRDATLTIRALLDIGYQEEASAFVAWLLHATHLTWPNLQVLYDVFGRNDVKEHRMDQLSGYRGSRPVRVGNDARKQFQLDLYGEVIGAVHEFVMRAGEISKGRARTLRELGEVVCERWDEPDDGIWELRAERQHYVHSKVMCWRALDNLLEMHEHGHLKDLPLERFKSVRDRIRESIETRGFDVQAQSYTQAFDGSVPDASLLLLPVQRYVDADAPRMRSTYRYLKEHLCRNGVWYRYPEGHDDGLPGTEGAFGTCGFWAAEYLARRGDVEAATQAFERVLSFANDVGLFAEEMDPDSGAALGNYPQAFTHIGLINAALAIAGCEK